MPFSAIVVVVAFACSHSEFVCVLLAPLLWHAVTVHCRLQPWHADLQHSGSHTHINSRIPKKDLCNCSSFCFQRRFSTLSSGLRLISQKVKDTGTKLKLLLISFIALRICSAPFGCWKFKSPLFNSTFRPLFFSLESPAEPPHCCTYKNKPTFFIF